MTLQTGWRLRLFCRWMEDGPLVDLDLSVALYDGKWLHVGTCDYTRVRVTGAVHAVDLISSPAPYGASQFVDMAAPLATQARMPVLRRRGTVLSHRHGRMLAMVARHQGLRAQIEAGVLDDTLPVSSLLQKCVLLGGQAGSQKMVDWARQELNGYDPKTAPEYRRLSVGLIAVMTNPAGYNPMHQRISDSVLPPRVREFLREEGTDLDIAVLHGNIGQLEALARTGKAEHTLIPWWGDIITDLLNKYSVADNTRVQLVYWPVSDSALKGLLVQVRTALAELVAELDALTPQGQDVPDKAAADHAVQVVVTGDQNRITVTSQHAGNGTNISVGAAGPVTASGALGTAVGSQSASGARSSIVGAQSTHGDHATVTGQHASDPQPADERSWWARLRKRGVIVAFSTVVAAAVAVFTWTEWTPWK